MTNKAAPQLNSIEPMCAAILDSSYNGVVIINRKGVVVFYNQAALRMLGYEDGSPVGKHFSTVLPETWPDMKEILATGVPQIGKRIVFPKATIVANRNPIIVNGQVLGVVSIFQDISEYERIISELQGYQELHRQLEAIFESSYDGFYITDGQANTIRVNSAYERITGLNREDLIGRNMQELVEEKFFDHSVTLAVLEKKHQITLMQKIKGDKQVMVTGTPVFDEKGDIVLVVTTVTDITLLNKLRSELEQSRRLSSRYYQALLEHEKYEHALQDMVIKSSSMIQVVQKAIKVASVDTSVLLLGESGVGKSMLARIIHLMSPRKERPFVKINCGTIPEALMESELFGYKKGAFTGAAPEGKAGLIEAAHTGTVFLDEIGDLTPAMQVKLLQVIEEKSFTRVGSTQPTSVDVRIIAATNRDLKGLVQAGKFRQDLYYRLNVIPIFVPPLRERREDIPALALNILEKFQKTHGLKKRMEPEVMDRLMRFDYPGNVRELINLMERMVIMSDGEAITLQDLPIEFRESVDVMTETGDSRGTLKERMHQVEARILRGTIQRCSSLVEASRVLGIHYTTLWRKLVKHGISVDDAMLQ
jgi:PAS domain S-box-containing protein|uniref:PAS domain S-box protein n=1 Tax=Desulfomonile tiedjei TaxID=2358 RepID=A0A7C4EV13_9BACT